MDETFRKVKRRKVKGFYFDLGIEEALAIQYLKNKNFNIGAILRNKLMEVVYSIQLQEEREKERELR